MPEKVVIESSWLWTTVNRVKTPGNGINTLENVVETQKIPGLLCWCEIKFLLKLITNLKSLTCVFTEHVIPKFVYGWFTLVVQVAYKLCWRPFIWATIFSLVAFLPALSCALNPVNRFFSDVSPSWHIPLIQLISITAWGWKDTCLVSHRTINQHCW